jgi:hypothetical protein
LLQPTELLSAPSTPDIHGGAPVFASSILSRRQQGVCGENRCENRSE